MHCRNLISSFSQTEYKVITRVSGGFMRLCNHGIPGIRQPRTRDKPESTQRVTGTGSGQPRWSAPVQVPATGQALQYTVHASTCLRRVLPAHSAWQCLPFGRRSSTQRTTVHDRYDIRSRDIRSHDIRSCNIRSRDICSSYFLVMRVEGY